MNKQLFNDLKLIGVRWLFNGLMLAGAVLVWFIGGGLGRIRDTIRHTGPGVVHYEYDSEEVSESQFKRHHYTLSGMAIFLGVSFWISVAWGAKEDRAAIRAHFCRLEATAKAWQDYHYHFESVLDKQTRKRAEDECLSEGLEWKYHNFHVVPKEWRVPEWLTEPMTDDEKRCQVLRTLKVFPFGLKHLS